MDKYTYNIKADKIQKLVKKGDFEAAVKIADTIDWEEVRSVRLLTITAAAYENLRDYKSAIELLQMAYEESAVGKRILYKLTGLAIAEGDVELAQHYYEMYLQEASDDNGRYLLRYLLAELKKEPLDKRIAILETYRKYEFEEEWALRLAQMYDEAGMGGECVKLCDEIILWFGVGDYVDEAMALKEKYAPLSESQKEHRDNKDFYEQRYQDVVNEYTSREEALTKRDQEEAEPAAAAQKAEVAWARQILLIESESLEEAVPRALERLSIYYRAKGLPMCKLTRISAERFNELGFEGARSHLEGKDLLVDDASALSEDLLSDIVHSVKYEQNPQLFVLTDKPSQLAYLDARLGEYVENDVAMPQIDVSEPQAEGVLKHVSEAMEEQEAKQSAAENAVQDDLPRQDWATAAEVDLSELEIEAPSAKEEATEEKKEKKETAEIQSEEPETKGKKHKTKAEKSAQKDEPAEGQEKKAEIQKELTEEKEDKTEDQIDAPKKDTEVPSTVNLDEEVQWTFDDFLRDQSAAFSAAMAKSAESYEEEAAPQPEEAIWQPFVGNFDLEAETSADEIAQKITEEVAEETPATKRIPVEAVKKALEEAVQADQKEQEDQDNQGEREDQDDQDLAQTMLFKLEAAEEEAEREAEPAQNQPLEGETKTVKKVSAFTGATGAIGSIGMSEEAFVEYAKNYLLSIDCVLDDVGDLALQNAAEARVENGVLLTKEEAENMIENAADLAEKKGGLFVRRYDKEGCLILRSKYIK